MDRRRHHSWPFSGSTSDVHVAEVPSTPIPKHDTNQYQSVSRKRKPADSFADTGSTFSRPLTPELLLYSSSDEDDDLFSAGIIDVKRETWRRRHRAKWEKPKRQSRSSSDQTTVLSRSPETRSNEGHPEENIVSSITEASEAPAAKLRRYLWPQLEKMRHFFLPIHSFGYLTGGWLLNSRSTNAAAAAADESRDGRTNSDSCGSAGLISTSPPASPHTASQEDEHGKSQLLAADSDWMLRPGRRHRRCHSEQPRAWREPSPGLWTLAEE